MEDKLPVRFQLQMHKFIWDSEAEGSVTDRRKVSAHRPARHPIGRARRLSGPCRGGKARSPSPEKRYPVFLATRSEFALIVTVPLPVLLLA